MQVAVTVGKSTLVTGLRGAGCGEGVTGGRRAISGVCLGFHLPFSKGRGVGVGSCDFSSEEPRPPIGASSSPGRGEGSRGSEKQGVGGISTGSWTRETVVGIKKSNVAEMAQSRAFAMMKSWVRVPFARCAFQRAIEVPRSVLKAMGKGVLSGIVPRRATTSASLMLSSQMRGGTGVGGA